MNQVFEDISLSRRNQHLVFWLSWTLSFTFIKSIGYPMPVYFDWLIYYILTLPVFIAHTYIVAYWLVPKFFITKRYGVFSLIFFSLLYAFSVIELLLSNELIFGFLSERISVETDYLDTKNVIISGIGNHYIIVLFLAVKVLKNWYRTENNRSELQLQTIESEIQLLKHQLQPRFLLNVMGILENMAIEKSKKTPDMIIRISNLLNNVLVDNSNDIISLRKEVNLIESYVEIQKMVKGSGLSTQVILSGDSDSRKIPVLSFFPFVEKFLELLVFSNEKSDFRVFVKSENNYLLFITSFHYYKDPYFKIEDDLNRLIQRLSFYYGNNFSTDFTYEDEYVELTIEILKS